MRRSALVTTVLTAVLALAPAQLAAAAPPPKVSDVEPDSGHVTASVTVTGTDLDTATQVTFGGVPATFQAVSPTELVASVPKGAVDGPVAVTTPNGTASSGTAFDVLPPVPTALSLAVTPHVVSFGSATSLVSRLSGPGDAPVPGQGVRFYARPRGRTAYSLLGTVPTDHTGTARLAHRPAAHQEYLTQHPAGPAWTFSSSQMSRALVRPRLSARALPLAVEQHRLVTFDGFVTPPHPGHAVRIQRHLGGSSWADAGWTTIGADGRFAWTTRFASVGTFTFRVRKEADADHLEAVSAPFRLTVVLRTLRSGMVGGDVLAVQRRLAELRFDVGAINGYYGYDTMHAVQAFEKFYGLYRDGVVTTADRARIIGAPMPTMRFPRSGLAVEVDLTRQVVVLGRDGIVQRVVDASSGNGKVYYDRGRESYAVTPEGFFRVERKINGERISSLGTLWRPAYFYGGYAIHGSSSVPAYPASHGCIRVTNPAMDRLYPVLPVGTPVRVYRS